MKLVPTLVLSIASLSALSISAMAQNQNQNQNQNGGRGGNFGDFSERIKASIKATDEEWTVLKPLVENVMNKQRDSMGFGGRGGRGGPGGNNNGGNNAPTTPAAKASQDLRDLLDKENASPEELKAKLAAVRDNRKKSQAELTQAREELRKVLTLKQEAYFVSRGMLE